MTLIINTARVWSIKHEAQHKFTPPSFTLYKYTQYRNVYGDNYNYTVISGIE